MLLTFPPTHDKIPQHVANDSRERFTVSTVVSKSAFSLKTGLKMAPAKGVGVYKAREGSNPSFCAMIYPLRKQGINHIILLFFKKPFVFQRSKFQSVLLKNSISEYGELPKRS